MSDTDNDDESTVYSKPHLDPQAVISLATSIPNCSQVSPPNECRLGRSMATSNNNANNANTDTYTKTQSESTASSYFSTGDTSSYFSQFSRHLHQTFSAEDTKDATVCPSKECPIDNAVLSFLVSDAYSIEQLAAEADGKHSTIELEGAGIARIDVYCQSGTVCTCRVIQTTADGYHDIASKETTASATTNTDSFSRGSSFMNMISTPQMGNVTRKSIQTTNNALEDNIQVRRIIRRKCTIEGLRRILEQPPKLPEVNASIISPTTTDGDDGGNTNIDSDDGSTASTVSKKLRKRQQKRQNNTFSKLSKAQQTFLKAQQKKYEKRIRRDEKVREHVGNAILAGGMVGVEGVDLSTIRSLSLDSVDGTNHTSDSMSISEDRSITPVPHPKGDAYHAQKKIQEKIEIADMGLAILMGEAQRLERIIAAIHEETKEKGEGGLGCTSKQGSRAGNNDDTDRSFSTFQSTDRDFDSDSSSSSNDSEDERKLARIMQGCEVEYSFPHEYHDQLEGALMGEDPTSEDDSSSSNDDDSEEASRASSVSKVARRRRGRSPPVSPHGARKEYLSSILAIPCNGEGCIILRENGAFDVIGKVPEVLRKKLFRPKGPLPNYVFLGTMGRYYVHFDDGSFFFYGPPSLSKILIKGNKKQRRGKDRNRGKKGEVSVSVVSVAFGKQLDDFFVVMSDGSWEAHGSLPPGLEGLMSDRKSRADLLWVALGINGEWCVKSQNGRVWWGGVSDEVDEALSEILAEDGANELRFIDFGKDETYFLLHK